MVFGTSEVTVSGSAAEVSVTNAFHLNPVVSREPTVLILEEWIVSLNLMDVNEQTGCHFAGMNNSLQLEIIIS